MFHRQLVIRRWRGTITGSGTALTVTNNFSVGGVSTFGNTNANWITVVGSPSAPTISSAGAGPNAQLVLRGLGSGVNGQVNIGGTSGGGAFNVIGATANGGTLRITQPSTATAQFVFDIFTNTVGVQWSNVPTTFTRSYAWSGAGSNLANRTVTIGNTISGRTQDLEPFSGPVVVAPNITAFNSFTAVQGIRCASAWGRLMLAA